MNTITPYNKLAEVFLVGTQLFYTNSQNPIQKFVFSEGDVTLSLDGGEYQPITYQPVVFEHGIRLILTSEETKAKMVTIKFKDATKPEEFDMLMAVIQPINHVILHKCSKSIGTCMDTGHECDGYRDTCRDRLKEMER
jgi:hypothetical protein